MYSHGVLAPSGRLTRWYTPVGRCQAYRSTHPFRSAESSAALVEMSTTEPSADTSHRRTPVAVAAVEPAIRVVPSTRSRTYTCSTPAAPDTPSVVDTVVADQNATTLPSALARTVSPGWFT